MLHKNENKNPQKILKNKTNISDTIMRLTKIFYIKLSISKMIYKNQTHKNDPQKFFTKNQFCKNDTHKNDSQKYP